MSLNFSEINPIDILNTGITGFAFLLLLLGYRLTSAVQSQILSTKPNEFDNVEMFREWKDMVCVQLRNTQYFLAIALVFFAGGLANAMHNAESNITVEIIPLEEGMEPTITHLDDSHSPAGNTIIPLNVKDDHKITINSNAIVRELYDLRLFRKNHQEITRTLISKETETSSDAGFDL